jgi:hypothetical protein
MVVPRLTLAPDEIDDLRVAMRDAQESVAQYYYESRGFIPADDLVRHARAAVGFIQKLNDVLLKRLSISTSYAALFDPPLDHGAEIIEAFRFIRNVGQHLPEPVKIAEGATFGGMGIGFRSYSTWQDVPLSVDSDLYPSTRALRPFFDAHLRGEEVTQTMLDALNFFWRVCPELVHRDVNGEWAGFPLRSQPGVRYRLHPEEPSEEADAIEWMNARRPGGSCRVVCGITAGPTAGADTFYGVTFDQQWSFTPFFETRAQVDRDIGLGHAYHVADLAANTRFLPHKPAIFSTVATGEWVGPPITSAPADADCVPYMDADFWNSMRYQEGNQLGQAFITRRSRRLNAGFPAD